MTSSQNVDQNRETNSDLKKPITNDLAALKAEGEAAKLDGMELAARSRYKAIAANQLGLLKALLRSPNRTATIDDATPDLSVSFECGGMWRGSVCLGLSKDEIIERVDTDHSKRPSRRKGFVSVWRLIDPNKARKKVERLTAFLSKQGFARINKPGDHRDGQFVEVLKLLTDDVWQVCNREQSFKVHWDHLDFATLENVGGDE